MDIHTDTSILKQTGILKQAGAHLSRLRWAVVGCLLLLVSALPALEVSSAHAQDTPVPTLDAALVKTVGTTPGVCAPAGSVSVDVAPGTTVYVCYTLTNTGSVALEPIDLIDNYDTSNFEPVAWEKPPGFVLEPGATLAPTTANGLIRAVTANTSLSSYAGWAVVSTDGAQRKQLTSNSVNIQVVTLSTQATLGASTAAGATAANCSSPTVTLTSFQNPAYLCVTLTNSGSITLTQHQITIPGFGINFSLTKPLGPSGTVSATLRITNVDSSSMAPKLSAPTMTSRAIVTSTNDAATLSVSTTSEPVVVNGPPTSVSLLKTLNTDPNTCSATTALTNVTYGQTLYYCLVLINAASLTYTNHIFTEAALNISGSFNEVLPPGGRISITNSFLQVNKGITPFLGPITATVSINNTMTYTASEPSLGYRAVALASASISVLTPTPTNTGAPTATNTPIGFETSTLTPSITPIPATPTPTWTWTPLPTPTPSPTVLVYSTPGGQVPTPYPPLPGMAVAQANPFVSPLVDPFGATATAQAMFAFPTPVLDPFGATATAQAMFAFPTPVLDPFGATATAQAMFAFPTPVLDPFSATATAQAMFAFPTPVIDPFGATAAAQAQSPLPTPVIDPLGATATAQALIATPTPALDPAAAASATAQIDALVATAIAQAATVTAAIGVDQPSTDPSAPTAMIVMSSGVPLTDSMVVAPQRPLAEPTAGPALDSRSFFVRVLESAGSTVALLWLLGGSVLFFVTAGVLAGLSFRAKEKARFSLEATEGGGELITQPQSDPQMQPQTKPKADDNWPESLP